MGERLFVVAITLHNFPEGMAVGVGFGGGMESGTHLGIAIFLQNLPEGARPPRRRVQPLAGCARLLRDGARRDRRRVRGRRGRVSRGGHLPWAMGFAAGAMLFVISHEIVPETHRNGYEAEATFGLLAGFVGMLVMGAVLG